MVRYLKTKPMVNRASRVPDIRASILVFSSNINWGKIGFLLINTDDASNFSIMVLL